MFVKRELTTASFAGEIVDFKTGQGSRLPPPAIVLPISIVFAPMCC
jgi:hypothetical protein